MLYIGNAFALPSASGEGPGASYDPEAITTCMVRYGRHAVRLPHAYRRPFILKILLLTCTLCFVSRAISVSTRTFISARFEVGHLRRVPRHSPSRFHATMVGCMRTRHRNERESKGAQTKESVKGVKKD
jgi:hypothetical protein